MKFNDVIYCLAEIDGMPFYVGRSVDYQRRHREHIATAKNPINTEAKYQKIREIWRAGSDFEMIIIDYNPGVKYERYYHYMLGVDHELTNQRMGDTQQAMNEINRDWRNEKRTFASPVEFLSLLDLEIKERRAREKAKKTQDRIRSKEITTDSNKTLFSFEDPHKKFISPMGSKLLAARGRTF